MFGWPKIKGSYSAYVSIALDQLKLSPKALELMIKANVNWRLSITDSFNTDKPVMVFLPATSTCKEVFESLAEDLADEFRVILIDLPGNGASSKVSSIAGLNDTEKAILAEQLYSFDSIVEQLFLALNQRGITKASVFGWSAGGHFAHGLLMRYPAFVTSMVTSGAPPIDWTREGFQKGFSDGFNRYTVPSWTQRPHFYEKDEAVFIAKSLNFCFPEDRDAYLITALQNSDPLYRKYLLTTAPAQLGSSKSLRTVVIENGTIPICIIEGEDDLGLNFEYIASFWSDILYSGCVSNYEYHVIPGYGHDAFRSEEFSLILHRFLSTKVMDLNNPKNSDVPSSAMQNK